ncbi:MAG: hypothetical protein NT105_06635 [Verrucomicrobia bacterium]|nr:hypothetical protein [Verrucomicrobiota bacterium]
MDNPNCRWGDPSYILEPGDPGYVPWPPGPQPKPPTKHKQYAPAFVPAKVEGSNTMSTFQFVILPNPRNTQRPFRARPDLGEAVPQDDYLNAVATDAGVARPDVEKVIRSLFKVMVGYLRLTRPIGPVLDLFRAFPSITGSFATNTPVDSELKAGIGFTIAPTPEAQAAMTTDLSVEKVDEHGTIKPVIDSIQLSPGGQMSVYSTTAAFQISGDHFRGSGQNQPWPKVYLLDSNMGTPAQLSVFACSQTELLVQPVPTGTTGTRYLKIVAGWDETLFTVSEELTLAT